MVATPFFPQLPKSYTKQIVAADTTTTVDVFTAATNGTRIDAIAVTMTFATAVDLLLYINNGTTDFLLGRIQIPVSSGNTNSAPTVFPLNSNQLSGLCVDGFGNPYLFLTGGFKLRASVSATLTSTVMNIICFGADF